MSKPTGKQYRELRDFKLRVKLAIYNAQMRELRSTNGFEIPYVVIIDKAIFTFNSIISKRRVKRILSQFTTTRW